jgi:hypothetical protein
MPRGAARKTAAYEAAVATAASSQKPLLELAAKLKTDGVISGVQSLVAPNMLIVTPASGKSQAVLDAFRATGAIKAIYSNQSGAIVGPGGRGLGPSRGPFRGLDVLPRPQLVEPASPSAAPAQPYGIGQIGAPAAWAQGATGEGLVYGSIDTGVDPTHEAIAANYRGRGADGKLSHDYNWFDPQGGKTPTDTHGHGTHTIGTVSGSNGIGVAPKSRYISVAGLSGNVDSTVKALQWMFAPTKVDGTSPNPAMAPDVVGMSWWTGKNDEDLFLENILYLRAAGIEPVKSAGNNGPGARTISSPGQHSQLISTAAVDSNGNIARFSSRGPAPFPKGSTTAKPDFAAPGVDVLSSTPGNKYSKMSGTSMAQPHMSGAILSILSKYPELSHDQLIQVLQAGAVDKGATGFDFEYGAGIINIPASLVAAQRLLAGVPAAAGVAALAA